MFKKVVSCLISLTLIFTLFSVSASADGLSGYFAEPNRYVVKTNNSNLNDITEEFKLAKQNGTGFCLVINDVTIDFGTSYVLNNEVEIDSVTVAETTTSAQRSKNIKAYTISGFKNGLLKSNHKGIIEITLPFESKNGKPLVTNINKAGETHALYTTYNPTNKTVTCRADYFGSFVISDASDNELGYGRMLLSAETKGEKYTYIYDKLNEGVKKYNTEITLDKSYNVTEQEVSYVYDFLKGDYPEYYKFLGGYTYYTDDQDVVFKIKPYYAISISEHQNQVSQMNAVADILLEGIDVNTMGEYEASKIVYERLAEHVTYNLDAPYCHTGYAALVNREAVCDGYANAYQFLLKKLGIMTYMVSGIANGGGHAWSLVRINGEYYYTDATWGDGDGKIYYGYLNCSYDKMAEDHSFDVDFEIPKSTATKDNYFVVTKSVVDFNNLGEVNLVDFVKRQGPIINIQINNFTGENLLHEVFFMLDHNAPLAYMGLSSYGISASATQTGSELVIKYFDEKLAEIPSGITYGGNLVVGNTLTVSSTVSGYNNIFDHIIWYRNGIAIEGANGKSYTLTQSDVESYITVAAYSKNYKGIVMYGQNQAVQNLPILSGSVTISGSAKVGSKLTAVANISAGSNLSYQWYRDGSAISGATSNNYTLSIADIDADLYCLVSSANCLGEIQSNVISNVYMGEYIPGDITGNTEVDSKDLTALRRYLADWTVSVNEAALDVNGDTEVNSKDATYLARHLADWNGYALS